MKNDKKETIVAVSGYFNPIHKGHIEMFEAASLLGDKLVVILNNDEQVKVKGSVPFMDVNGRAAIVEAIGCVDEVVVSLDTDKSVCKTLEHIAPNIFANGGDRKLEEIPENEVCRKLEIEMVFNVGEGKPESSSNLLRKVQMQRIKNPE